jgi:nucleoside-diphosphate-sugar epimerase
LITGASGFIGSQVATLARGSDWDVHTDRVDLLVPQEAERLIERVRPTHLIHLAWFVEPVAYWSSPLNERWADASAHLFRAFAIHGGRRLVGVGTSAEYDWKAGVLCEDATPLHPATLYGASKKRLAEEMTAICREHGVSGAWARLFLVYGPGEPPSRFIPTVIRASLEGTTARCADPLARDFIHVRDVAGALLALLGSPVEGAVNVGSGEAVLLRDVAALVGARVVLVTSNEASLVVADTTRLRKEVGFQPRIALPDGLRETVEWWRRRLNAGTP